MRKLSLTLTFSLLTLFSCESVPLSKQDSAILGAIGGAGIGAVTHKHFKASAKTGAIYGAVVGGALGYVVGSGAKSKHKVTAQTCYDKKLPDGRVVHVCEEWKQEDNERIK